MLNSALTATARFCDWQATCACNYWLLGGLYLQHGKQWQETLQVAGPLGYGMLSLSHQLSRYTTELHWAFTPAPRLSLLGNFSLLIRLYHDAKMLEVMPQQDTVTLGQQHQPAGIYFCEWLQLVSPGSVAPIRRLQEY